MYHLNPAFLFIFLVKKCLEMILIEIRNSQYFTTGFAKTLCHVLVTTDQQKNRNLRSVDMGPVSFSTCCQASQSFKIISFKKYIYLVLPIHNSSYLVLQKLSIIWLVAFTRNDNMKLNPIMLLLLYNFCLFLLTIFKFDIDFSTITDVYMRLDFKNS